MIIMSTVGWLIFISGCQGISPLMSFGWNLILFKEINGKLQQNFSHLKWENNDAYNSIGFGLIFLLSGNGLDY